MGLLGEIKDGAELLANAERARFEKRIGELETEIAALKVELATQQSVEFGQPYYWAKDGDPVPFCPICKVKDGKLAPMSDPESWRGGVRRRCHVCREYTFEQPKKKVGAVRRKPYSGPHGWMAR